MSLHSESESCITAKCNLYQVQSFLASIERISIIDRFLKYVILSLLLLFSIALSTPTVPAKCNLFVIHISYSFLHTCVSFNVNCSISYILYST